MSTKESIIFSHYATVLTLLTIGLSFADIKNLSTTEATMLLATYTSIEEFKQEQMDRNAKHRQAASHPQYPSAY